MFFLISHLLPTNAQLTEGWARGDWDRFWEGFTRFTEFTRFTGFAGFTVFIGFTRILIQLDFLRRADANLLIVPRCARPGDLTVVGPRDGLPSRYGQFA